MATKLLSNIKLSCEVHLNFNRLEWNKYSNEATYLLIKKRISVPSGIEDGTVVYRGKQNIVEDFDIRNGTIYYYRLFIFYDPNDEYKLISDTKCIIRAISISTNGMTDYSKYLYRQMPEFVRNDDKQHNNELEKFLQICAYALNKINVMDDTELDQLDVEDCDEMFLPYHAKWIGAIYDERFGADINRLILKTINEAEPWMGTATGLIYILQRVFKATVKIVEEFELDCTTNSEGLISNSFMTNGRRSINGVKIFFNDDNKWLSNIQTVNTITKIILNYSPLRTKFDIIYNLYSEETYDRTRMKDYLFDFLSEKVYITYNKTILDDMHDFIIDDIGNDDYIVEIADSYFDNVLSVYTEKDNHIHTDYMFDYLYEDYGNDEFTKEIQDSLLDISSNVVYEFYKNINPGTVINREVPIVPDYVNMNLSELRSLFREMGIAYSPDDTKEEMIKVMDSYYGFDGRGEIPNYENYTLAELQQLCDENGLSYTSETAAELMELLNFYYEAKYDIRRITDSTTNRSTALISNSLFTNSVFHADVELFKDKIWTNDNSIYDGASDEDGLVEHITITDVIPDAYSIDDIIEEFEDKHIDEFYEFVMSNRFGLTNQEYATLAKTFLTNAIVDRSEGRTINTSDKPIAKTSSTSALIGEMVTNGLYLGTYIQKDNVFDRDDDSYSISETEETVVDNIYNNSEDELLSGYEDDEVTNFIRVRPVAYTCSDCVISGNFYTTDISY